MFWQEETSADQFQISGAVVDLVFDINCRELPVDHASALATAIIDVLPWIGQDPRIGIHSVHVAGSQNGWVRPEHNTQNRLILSHRTKLVLRVPKEQQIPVQQGLTGVTLNVAACPMHIRQGKARPLSKHTTLLARHVDATDREDETAFLQWAAQELRNINIAIRKALCGKTVVFATANGPIITRSLLLAALSLEESLQLQQQGLGGHRAFGCGLFLPHKGINAVHAQDGE
jgi:CRISPR-associated protein Cas6